MKPEYWVPVAAFLGASLPVLLLLGALDMGGDYRVWIALAAGVLATSWAQSRLKQRGDKE